MSDNVDPDDAESAARAREAPLIGSRTLHRHTKDVLDRVECGESVVILRYGRPAAALVPINEEQAQAIVFASSPEMRGDSANMPDAAAEAMAEPFAIASAEVENDEQSEPWVVEIATLADTQREMRSRASDLLARLDQQALTIASLVRGHGGAASADASQQGEAGGDPGLT